MTDEKYSLSGRVAIVTGAGKGLGRAYAIRMASLGARVVVNNRTSNESAGSSSADAVVDEIRAGGGEAIANYDSVEHAGSGDRLVSLALQHFGGLDIIVSNAGIDRASSFRKQDSEDFEYVMQINFHSVAHLLRAAWPHLLEANYGRIVVSSSTAGLYGNHGQAAYSASKAALLGLVKTLAIEGAPHGVLVNTIAPYAVTQLTRPWFPEQNVEQFSPDSVAALVAWLVSDQCELCGETIIAGANHARLAQTLETDSLILGADPQLALEKLLSLSCKQVPPASASAEFEDFIRAISR